MPAKARTPATLVALVILARVHRMPATARIFMNRRDMEAIAVTPAVGTQGTEWTPPTQWSRQ